MRVRLIKTICIEYELDLERVDPETELMIELTPGEALTLDVLEAESDPDIFYEMAGGHLVYDETYGKLLPPPTEN